MLRAWSGLQVVNVSSLMLCMQNFDVFFAQDKDALLSKIRDGDTAWCGLERLLSGHRHKCSIRITPFQTTFVGIVPSEGLDLFRRGICLCEQLLSDHFRKLSRCRCSLSTPC